MYIYKSTNLINFKIYIGQSIHQFKNTYFGSGIRIKASVKKYGRKNFIVECIEYCNSQEHLNEREIYWISYHDSRNPEIGYNISPGGQSGWSNGLTKEDHIGLQAMSDKARRRKGISASEETKQLLRELATGRFTLHWFIDRFGEEKGSRMYEKRNKLISERMKGAIPWNKGKSHKISSLLHVKIILEEKVYSKRRGKTIFEYYGEERGLEILEKNRIAHLGISLIDRFGEEKTQEIVKKRLKTRAENNLLKDPKRFRLNQPKSKKIKHLESGLIFETLSFAMDYYNISKYILLKQIKNGIFEEILKEIHL